MKAHGRGSGGLIVRGPREDARGGVEARTRGKAVDPIGERVEIGVDRDQLELERLTFGTVDPRRRADEARRAIAARNGKHETLERDRAARVQRLHPQSEARRVGKEGDSTCRPGCSPQQYK